MEPPVDGSSIQIYHYSKNLGAMNMYVIIKGKQASVCSNG